LRGQAAGEIASDADADALATFLVSNLYGLQLLGRANLGIDARRKTLTLVLGVLG
jgi:hypothetical protein